jgi:UDP-N-acetylglucosamine:LPS N-acetylglucosamine transferase
MSAKCALIMAGGTPGGHIFPGLAVAQALRERGWRVHWLGTPGGMESEIVPPRGFAFEGIDFAGVRGKGWLTLALLPLRLLKAFWQSVQVVRRVVPMCWWGWAATSLSRRADGCAARQAPGAARAELGGRHGQQGAGGHR